MTDFIRPDVDFFAASPDVALAEADIALFGAPHGTPYPDIDNTPNADAPTALRRALADDRGWEHHVDFDLGGPLLDSGSNDPSPQERTATDHTWATFVDLGDLQTTSHDGPANRVAIERATRDIITAGATPIMIGGDDSVPIPFFSALDTLGPLTIVQIDAHIDWREARRGEPLGFSSTMRRASEMPHVEAIVQVGIRGLGSAHPSDVADARAWGAQLITARELHHSGVDAVVDRIPQGTRIALTIDCDGLDAGIMPAVMAPTPGGLTYLQATDLIHGLARRGHLAAVAMVEFVPARDVTGTAAITAARVLANAVGSIAHNRARTN
ncbi:MAG: arginase family protein [Pseudomonadota bacterium]